MPQTGWKGSNLASGAMTPIGDPAKEIAYGAAEYAPDGTLWTMRVVRG